MDAGTRRQAVQTVYNLFDWLNGYSGKDAEMTLADMQRLFTPDAVMTLNGRAICQGLEGHLMHSRDLQNKMKSWRFNTPFEKVVVEGDTVVGYYTVDFVAKDGTRARAYDMCFWTVKDGKIASTLENVIFAGKDLDIESYA